MGSMKNILKPESVALIGATDREGSIGLAILNNLLKSDKRPLFPVNPNRKSVLGNPCFSGIKEISQHVDLAVVVTPAPTVPSVARECKAAGVGGLVIISAGFGESGRAGRQLEKELIEIRKNCDMRIVGPNSMGIMVPQISLNATFLPTHPEPGKIAFISQSGAVGDALLEWGANTGIGLSLFASLGSMIDVGFGDLIDYLGDDYDTKSIMIFMENAGDARRLIGAARAFTRSKPIVVFKPGRSSLSAQAVAAHTGKQPGDDRVYEAVFKRTGIVRVKEVGDLFNVAQVLDSRHLPRGPRLAIITNAGGVGIAAIDILAELGGELAVLTSKSICDLDRFLPPEWSRNNPVDIVGDADTERYVNALSVCLKDVGADGIIVIYTPRAAADSMDLARRVIETAKHMAKPVIAVWMGGERVAESRRFLRLNNIPAYSRPEEAVKTYFYMYRYQKNIELLYETPSDISGTEPRLKNYLRAIISRARLEQQYMLTTSRAVDLVKNYGFRVAGLTVVSKVDDVRKAAVGLGLPLSIIVRDRRGEDYHVPVIATGDELESVCRELSERPAGTEFVVEKPALRDTVRLTLESRRDPDFRTVILLGNGTEKTIALPPLNQTLAQRLLQEAGIYREHGERLFRQLEEAILGFSNLIVDFPEIETVRLVLSVHGQDLLVEDAKVILDRNYSGQSPYPHLVIAPYPSRYISLWNLPDGTEVILRPIKPEDEQMSKEMFDSVSEESLRVRFFSVRRITHDLLMRCCNIDYDREIAIVAEIKKNGGRSLIGGARFVSDSDMRRAEFAILVHDDYQGTGLGAKLIDILIGIAEQKGLAEIYGDVLSDNDRMLRLARKLGFDIKTMPDGVSRVSLPLTGPVGGDPCTV